MNHVRFPQSPHESPAGGADPRSEERVGEPFPVAESPLANIDIPGGWSERAIAVGDRELRLLLPATPDALLEQIDDAREGPVPVRNAEPYWAHLWSAAQPLAQAISRAEWESSHQVLELGCGIGLAGLAARAAGCEVTWSDLVPEAVQLALANSRRNGFADRIHGLVLDWNSPPILPRFQRIIASDVLYQPATHASLARMLLRSLAEDGEAWIADPGRSVAPAFIESLEECGLRGVWHGADDQPLPTLRLTEFGCLRIRRRRD